MNTTTSSSCPSKRHLILAFSILYIVWGSTYLAIKFAIETLPPYMMASVRCILAGLILFAFLPASARVGITRKHWQSAAIIGSLLLGIGNGGVVIAEMSIPSGVVSLLVALTPMLIALLEHFPKVKVERRQLSGLLCGSLGILLLVGPQCLLNNTTFSWSAILTLFVACLSWTIGSIYSRTVEKPASTMVYIAMQMICGGLFLSIFSAVAGEYQGFNIRQVSAESIWALFYLIGFGSILGYGAYIWLLQNVSPSKVSTYAYVNPIIAVLLGWLLGGESLGVNTIVAAAFILAAVWLINSKSKKEKQDDQREPSELLPVAASLEQVCALEPVVQKELSVTRGHVKG
jgi:drug/metabolite transporter (DMT)-like permease